MGVEPRQCMIQGPCFEMIASGLETASIEIVLDRRVGLLDCAEPATSGMQRENLTLCAVATVSTILHIRDQPREDALIGLRVAGELDAVLYSGRAGAKKPDLRLRFEAEDWKSLASGLQKRGDRREGNGVEVGIPRCKVELVVPSRAERLDASI